MSFRIKCTTVGGGRVSAAYGIGGDFTAAAWAAGCAALLIATETPESWQPAAQTLTLIHVFLASAYGARGLTTLIRAANTSKEKSIDTDAPTDRDYTL